MRKLTNIEAVTSLECRNSGDNGNEGGSSDEDGFELNHFVFMIKRTCEFEKE